MGGRGRGEERKRKEGWLRNCTPPAPPATQRAQPASTHSNAPKEVVGEQREHKEHEPKGEERGRAARKAGEKVGGQRKDDDVDDDDRHVDQHLRQPLDLCE